jgi:hypothetical protein
MPPCVPESLLVASHVSLIHHLTPCRLCLSSVDPDPSIHPQLLPHSPPTMDNSTRKRPQLDEEISLHSRPTPLNNNKMPRTDATDTSLAHSAPPSPFERLTPALVQLIAQFLPPRARMAHLPHLSHSVPPITSAAFQEVYIILTDALMRSMSASGRVRGLSAVPALSFESGQWRELGFCDQLYPFLHPSPSSSPDLRPPFLSGVKECIIHLD